MMYDTQCSSCGGFCGRGGCEREDVKPKQEPVAWISEGGGVVSRSKQYMDEMGFISCPLYEAPPAREWRGLTEKEIRSQTEHYGVVRYFEKMLKERNT